MIRKICLFIVSFALSVSAISQRSYTTTDPKAIKAFEKGMDHFYGSNPMAALREFERAIKLAPDFIEPNLALGDIYYENNELEKALSYYQNVIRIDEAKFPQTWILCGKIYFELEQYKDARDAFENALKHNLSKGQKEETELLLKRTAFIIEAIENPVGFNPVNMGENINTSFSEYLPSLTSDGQTLIFTRRLPRTENTLSSTPEEEDLYISVKTDDVWGKALRMPEPVNSYWNEGSQCISQEGKYLFFTACDRPDGFGSCDIYICEKIGDQWSEPKNLGRQVNTSAWESQPSLSIDGKTLYFVSNRRGGKGGSDIWKTTWLSNGQWTTPVNLGDSINTVGDESSPFIHYDNQTLYFSSNGHLGMGGFDIFSAKRKPDNSWTTPVNIGYPINTKHDESSLIVDPDGKTAIISSDKLDGYGKHDLYSFELYEEARPAIVSYMKGHVFDEVTKKPLNAQFEVIDLHTEEVVASSKSDEVTGNFLISLPTNKNYVLNVSKEGYLFYSDFIELVDVDERIPFLKDIPMKSIQVGESMILKNIFFDVNQYLLKEGSKIELNKLIQLLLKNKTLKIEISGHTDNTGDAGSNQVLSENRAKAVYEYLIEKGIPVTQLTYKGYGEEKPIDTNTTEDGKANNRRTEFIIIGK